MIRKQSRTLTGDVAALLGADKRPATHGEPQRVLELTGLEDRLLFSASPMSPEMLDAEAAQGGQQPDEAPEGDSEFVVGWAPPVDETDEWGLVADTSAEETTQQEFSEVTSDDLQPLADGATGDTTGGDEFVFQWDSGVDTNSSLQSEVDQAVVRRELVFVDANVEDYELLVQDILSRSEEGGHELEVVLLSDSRDGITQISEALAACNDLDAVHIVSHGTDRAVKLGNIWLQLDNLDGYSADIAGWGNALNVDADLLFYGSDLAASETGQTLLQGLAALTDADVAGSKDATGAAALGGDWELEYALGTIDARLAFTLDVHQNWEGLLHTSVVTTTTDAESSTLVADYLSVPLGFEQNLGQTDDQVDFLARQRVHGLFDRR